MAIGRLGSIKFTVSDDKICSFTDMSYGKSARTVEHEVYGSKPLTEWTGPGLDTLSMTIVLVSVPGGSTNKTARKLWKMLENRTLSYLVLGNKRIGSRRWMITDLSSSFEEVDSNGKVTEMNIDVTLQEYA